MKTKILFVVNNLDFFISHRINIANEAIQKGYEVHLAIESDKKFIQNKLIQNIIIHKYFIIRSSNNPLYEAKTFISLYNLIKKVKPNIIHLISLKPILYGGIISRIQKVPFQVISITGMGYILININKFKIRILKKLVFQFLKFSLGHLNQRIIFQNKNDMNEILNIKKINKKNIIIIPGSGVNLRLFNYYPENSNNNLIVMVSRLLKDKGVYEFIEAEKIINKKNNIRFWIIGDIDTNNPASLTLNDIDNIKKKSNVKFFGYKKNISKIYSLANIAVLPSYREGFPKSLIEASACGRPIITTDVPGCRDAIINNKTGLLVNVKNSLDLSLAIKKLIDNRDLRVEMGKQARLHAEKNFDISKVVKQHVNIYSQYKYKYK